MTEHKVAVEWIRNTPDFFMKRITELIPLRIAVVKKYWLQILLNILEKPSFQIQKNCYSLLYLVVICKHSLQ
ncbi:hypothetical protein Lsai_3375 [Legionella sainthelensi]|uniref:Uncharacterized protein n=1 Tax=Legionella sainthelensi TaxID=28087 RepID=A0A0W0YC78_9GAMM|nr:hypothetical protein Lsai_3375 [Legionella sainthelensi]VEH28604.1 Uncharacterised protein [Legionella sainthelensi]